MKKHSSLLLDEQLCFKIYSTSLAITQRYKPLLKELNLTYPQYLVMLVLWEKDKVSLKQICDRLRQKPGAITPVVKRLEAIGYISRTTNPKDERSIILMLSKAGAALKDKAQHIPSGVIEGAIVSLAQPAEFVENLDKLNNALKAME